MLKPGTFLLALLAVAGVAVLAGRRLSEYGTSDTSSSLMRTFRPGWFFLVVTRGFDVMEPALKSSSLTAAMISGRVVRPLW